MDIKIKKRLLWATLFSISFMGFLLSRVEWKHFSMIAGKLDITKLIAAFSVFILGNFVRTLRFNRLYYTDKKLIIWWNINAFYNFMTSTLPGGAGEAATAYALKRFSKFNLFTAFRILLISRLMDMFALSVLFFTAAAQISNVTPYRQAALWLSGTLFVLSSVALIPKSEQFILRHLQALPKHIILIQKICEKLNELLEMKKKRRSVGFLAVTLIQSVLIMIGGVTALHLILQSFGIDFTLIQSFYCYGVYAVFQIVPVHGIAGIGTQAAWFALALNTAGYHSTDVVALGFVIHSTFYTFIIILGLSALLIWSVCQRANEV